MITSQELARIRSAAIGDMLGDSKALDEMGSAVIIFRLFRELERLEREADFLEQSNLWIAAVAFNGTASDYGSLYGLVEAARKAVEEGR